MTIYLYVKTHNKTGLKYLGKTVSKNPHKYKGSGIYWSDHIKKHGYDVTTEILKECSSEEEIKEWGIYYSNLWNIVDSIDENGKKTWANLRPEMGDGGRLSPESIKKGLETKKTNGNWDNRTDESYKKGALTRIKNGTNKKSPESITKRQQTLRERNNGPWSEQFKIKQRQTREKNGKMNSNTPESIEAAKKTRLMNNKPHISKTKITCEQCGKIVGKPNYLRSHGEKCGTLKGKQSVGKENSRYNPTILHFYNIITEEHIQCSRYELYTTFNLNKGSIGALCNGKIIEHNGWILEENLEKFKNHPDNIKHKFLNINTSEEKEMTILELSRTYNIRYNLIKRMVNNRNHKIVKGWTVL